MDTKVYNPDKHPLKERVKLLPSLPGVYRFYDKEGVIIYVGKAKNLKNRVSQYFNSPHNLTGKTKVMVSKIAEMQHTVMDSEEDALLLENNLIKEYQPRYNVMLKDGKTYPWICIKNEPFPRVISTRRMLKDKSKYFGPYSSALQVYNMIELISNLYYLRDCKLDLSSHAIGVKKYRPCLKYHIGKCKAPCISNFSEEDYLSQISKIESLLKGDISSLLKDFKRKMFEAAEVLDFESAQKYKEKIELLNGYSSKSLAVSGNMGDVDIFALLFETEFAYGNYMRLVNGHLIQSMNMEFKNPLEESEESVMSLFISEVYSKFGKSKGEVIVSHLPDLESFRLKCHIPVRGDKSSLLKLSIKNAMQLKSERLKQEERIRPEDHKRRVTDTLMKDLGMDTPPLHIECFDNSNIQGKFAVSACVVFRDGQPSKKEYRHFNVKSVVGANDFATMKEVLNRRYSRMIAENTPLPQLIVIDGGRGQLNTAWEALRELGLEDKIKVLGIAKRLEELIIPGDPHPLFLDKNSMSLKVIMHLRNEAHRFGITHHRNKRSKGFIEGELDSVKGIGERSKIKILKQFGSVAAIKRASYEELEKLIGKRGAKALSDHFSKA